MCITDTPKVEPDARAILKAHFSVPLEQHGAQWSALWDQGDFLPWDRKAPSPALIDLLAERGADELGLVNAKEKGLKALVPGCGKGYDVLLFASYGVDAAGVEISENAVKAAKVHAEETLKTRGPLAGDVKFLQGDFYQDEWVRELGAESGFDLVYDYTFLCAMPPDLRPAWAQRMMDIVKPGTGYLICLEFPLYKSLETGGPPWGLTSAVYEELLSGKFEKIVHYKPERTHQIGMGTDYITVWRRKSN
ncbi:S-adenosyl-L-methionine-dependent methyltransferase [Sphaerosporella brunnea]|uniref:S-adenosyl-L-methionine-dependent methyltransferase n=1 Tax=Sphaerosporella brunnea TaxID=1250544 RepID=A0A5J5EXH5_9PEZI|nr:S-adenosyl-L-methionine-dependent methyltransferase [Sphaerosporella brunnea]